MIPRPPRSTLFPYRTLFLSRSPHRLLPPLCSTVARFFNAAGAKEVRDRKSTRLNSSHANISYAVFCLKKKKYTKINIKEAHITCNYALCKNCHICREMHHMP